MTPQNPKIQAPGHQRNFFRVSHTELIFSHQSSSPLLSQIALLLPSGEESNLPCPGGFNKGGLVLEVKEYEWIKGLGRRAWRLSPLRFLFWIRLMSAVSKQCNHQGAVAAWKSLLQLLGVTLSDHQKESEYFKDIYWVCLSLSDLISIFLLLHIPDYNHQDGFFS